MSASGSSYARLMGGAVRWLCEPHKLHRNTVASLLVLPLFPLLGTQGTDAQLSQDSRQCYRFDRHYFHWMSDIFIGDSAVLNTATVVGDSLLVDTNSLSATLYKVLSDSSLAPWRSVFRDSSAVVILSPQDHPASGTPGAKALVAMGMPAVRSTRSTREWSFWRLVGPDTVEVAWLTGFGGTTLRLQVRGDTLRGRLRITTDVVGRAPKTGGAWALRIACMDEGSTPSDKRTQQTARRGL
jgi:hypothetical protein